MCKANGDRPAAPIQPIVPLVPSRPAVLKLAIIKDGKVKFQDTESFNEFIH